MAHHPGQVAELGVEGEVEHQTDDQGCRDHRQEQQGRDCPAEPDEPIEQDPDERAQDGFDRHCAHHEDDRYTHCMEEVAVVEDAGEVLEADPLAGAPREDEAVALQAQRHAVDQRKDDDQNEDQQTRALEADPLPTACSPLGADSSSLRSLAITGEGRGRNLLVGDRQ